MAVRTDEDAMPGFDPRGRDAYVPDALRGYKSDSRYKRQFARERKDLFYASPGGYNDPLSHMCVLDYVMRIETNGVIRAKYLWKFMKRGYPQVIWNPVVVGAILSEIANICEENFARTPDQRPIIKSRDWEGLRYRLNPTAVGWSWLETMRRYLGAKAADTAERIRDGQRVTRMANVYADLPERTGEEDFK